MIGINECKIGQIVARDVYSINGSLMVSQNTKLNNFIIARLREEHVQKISILNEEPETPYSDKTETFKKITKRYKENVSQVKSIINDLATGKQLDETSVTEVTDSIFDTLSDRGSILKCLSSVKSFDEYTYNHSVNVSFYSMLIASWLKLPDYRVKDAVTAGLLHDIGKSLISQDILNKKGSLTNDEFDLMKKHPIYGYNLLKKNAGHLSEEILNAVLMHHERDDGNGYPLGLKGPKTGFYAKIVAVADVYDALTSERVYKDRETPFDTFKILENTGIGHFDIKILFTFLQHIASFYIGSDVLMNNGDKGQVVCVLPTNISRPIVSVNGRYIDLSREKSLDIEKLAY